MASGGHPHATLTMPHPSYSGEDQGNNTSSSPLAVWTAQVPALSASGVVNGPSDLCWQMVESGQQAVQLRRRRNNQKLFHLGRTLLLKHLPRDVNEHVNTIFHIKSFFFSPRGRICKKFVPHVSCWGVYDLEGPATILTLRAHLGSCYFFVKLNTKKKFVSSSFVMATRIVKNLFSCWPWRAFPLWQIPFAFIKNLLLHSKFLAVAY